MSFDSPQQASSELISFSSSCPLEVRVVRWRGQAQSRRLNSLRIQLGCREQPLVREEPFV